MRLADQLGTIEPAKLADLIVVRGNPLADIRNTRHVLRVMVRGTLTSPALLESAKGNWARPPWPTMPGGKAGCGLRAGGSGQR